MTIKLTATVTDLLGRRRVVPVRWVSENPRVATVDAAGTVSVVSPGACTVTANAGALSAPCYVTVTVATA